MKLKYADGTDVTRRDLFFADPTKIRVKEELRGRSAPPTEEAIIAMAESLLSVGQLQPVRVRREGLDLVLTLGFTRCAAARVIRDGFVGSDGERHRDKEFCLQATAVDCNDDEAFRANIVENALRGETSPIDDAFNHRTLRDRHGMTNSQIAQLYNRDAAWVGRLQGLLQLDPGTQGRVHRGELAVSVALDALKLPPETRGEVLASATGESGKVNGSAVRKQVRDQHLRDQPRATEPASGLESPNTPDEKSKPLSMREVREYFELAADPKSFREKPVRAFARTALAWLKGVKSSEAMDKAVDALLDATRDK